jgi:hypothetical protein
MGKPHFRKSFSLSYHGKKEVARREKRIVICAQNDYNTPIKKDKGGVSFEIKS